MDTMKNFAIALMLMVALAGSARAENAAGKDLFASKCAICHGADGSGKTGMGKTLKIRDLRSAEVQKQPDADLKTIIAKGKGKMPAFEGKLTGEQIDQVTAYIRELGKQK
jgi:cytochrome c6